MNSDIQKYLSVIGRKGGLKSRRTLSKEQSKNMLKVREARRAFKKCFGQCFWSFDPNYRITLNDISWVIEQLQKHGNRYTMRYVEKLCH